MKDLKHLDQIQCKTSPFISGYPSRPSFVLYYWDEKCCTLILRRKGLFSTILFPTDLVHQQIRPGSMEKDFQQHFLWSQPDYQSIKFWTLTLIKILFSTRLWVALRSTLERGFRVSIFKIGFSPSEKFFRIGLLWWNLPHRPKISNTWHTEQWQKRWEQSFVRIWCFEQYFWWKYKGTKVQIARGSQENAELAT